jgi:hypothetical protein
MWGLCETGNSAFVRSHGWWPMPLCRDRRRIFNTPVNLNGDRLDNRAENLMWRPRWYAVLYNNQFEDRYPNPIEVPIREIETGEEFPNSMAAAAYFGLLEREIVLSILNHTWAVPTYQKFELVE